MNCYICNNPSKLAFIKNNYRILKCQVCGFQFTGISFSPDIIEEVYSDYYFNGGDAGYFDYTSESKLLIMRGEYYARKLQRFVNYGKMLDVGAAAGFILKGFENMGWKGMGIEPNENMVEYGKKNLGVALRKGTLEITKPDAKFDLVVMIQVIAHLFDLNMALENTSNWLNAQGYLLIETWDSRSLTAIIFGKHWHEYSPPSTLNYFDKRNLDTLLKKHNFKKVASGWPSKKIIGSHAKSLLKYKMKDNKITSKIKWILNIIPESLVLPYPAEDLFWVLYKKSLN